MGIYLNPDNENFKATLTRKIYVDKTMMIAIINEFMATDNKYLCVSRPRRFGKTIAGNMLSAYFSKGADSRALFTPYKIASDPGFESNLNKLNVIKIDINSEYRNTLNTENLILELTKTIRAEFSNQFSDIEFTETDSLSHCILKVYAAKKERFVIIMDEYDVLVRENVSEDLFNQYLNFLNGLFKSDTVRPAIALAYLTGILPVVRDRIQSKLNNFYEYTVLDARELAPFIGFTSEEVKALCKKHNVDYEECKRWYDGYKQHGFEIYNPESVVLSIGTKSFESFWGKTSTYAVISDRIQQNFDGMKDDVIKMLSGESVDVNVTRYTNTMTGFLSKDDAFTYLLHLGYLSYDRNEKTCRIPNKEVHLEWESAVSVIDEYSVTDRIIKSSKHLLAQTLKLDADAVAKSLDESHIHVTSNRSYNNEDALQSAVYLSYIYALNKYTIIKEMTTGKGYADVVFIPFVPDIPAMIIELKRNGSTESALNQIREKKYFDSMTHYKGNLLFIGVNYDEKSKTHTCKIEQMIM
ncbi:MAG: AAA family ATPase [Spirochaetaceae bacterium]|nr:AAA family ATPase [Spirochaetaceae bacterium]